MNFNGLISENGKDVSMGRVSFWGLFLVLLYFWLGKFILVWINGMANIVEIEKMFILPDGLMTTFLTLLSYNAFKKLPISNKINKDKE